MAQATNPKIEELRARIKSDPKSRLFFPLAEELRKMGGLDEAEQALRAGLEQHPTYLSAWVSLGRVLRERGNSQGVIEVLTRALELDPGNVVAARILADTYLEKGQKVEAIKKYKLVHALLPQDQDVDALIEKLELEINPPASLPPPTEAAAEAAPQAEERAEAPDFAPMFPSSGEETFHAEEASPAAFAEPPPVEPPPAEPSPAEPPLAEPPPAEPASYHEPPADRAVASAFDEPAPSALEAASYAAAFEAGSEPEPASSSGTSALRPSQFDDTAPLGYDSHAFAIEQPAGMHIASSPDGLSEEPTLVGGETDQTSGWSDQLSKPPEPAGTGHFFPSSEEVSKPWPAVNPPADRPADRPADDVTNTITMGDLYARQGLVDDAREIYSRLLERDPGNESVRAKLSELEQSPPAAPRADTGAAAKAARLEAWLSKVKRGSDSV
jgi:tetratricopeptide (TPR) repeat protein